MTLPMEQIERMGANLGTITSGHISNVGNTAAIRMSGTTTLPTTNYIDFTATGTSAFLKTGGVVLKANGDATLGNTTVMDNVTGVIGAATTQTLAGTARALMKGYQSGQGRDQGAVTFSPVYQNAPQVIIHGGLSYDSGLPAGPQYDDVSPTGLTASGFTIRAKLRVKAAVTARTAEFTASLTATTAGSTVGPATLANAPSNDTNYTARYGVTVVCQTAPEAPSGSQVVVIAIEVSADGSTGWTEYATRSHSVSRTTNGTTTTTYSAQEVAVSVASLTTASAIRLKLKSITSNGGDLGNAPTLEGYNYSPTTEGHGVTYNTSVDSFSSKTPDTDDYITWEAFEVIT